MPKGIGASILRTELERFPVRELEAEIVRCRGMLANAKNSWQRTFYRSRVHLREKVLATKSA